MVKRGRTGRMIYVPKPIIDLLGEVKRREKVNRNVIAWDKIGFLAGVGLNVEDGLDAFFGMNRSKRKRDLL